MKNNARENHIRKNHPGKNHIEAKQDFPAFLTLSWAWHEAIEDPAAVKAALARNLRHYREQRGLSHKALAKAGALELSTIRNIEAGGALPAIGVLVLLADLLGVSCGALVDCGASPPATSPRRMPASAPAREAHATLA
jgi:ribosome-binding protein aMBF1 (putative translation factor)